MSAQHRGGRQQSRRGGAPPRPPLVRPESKAQVNYGEPFIVMESDDKRTFVFRSGDWVPHNMSIAECRVNCQVKDLAQKMKGMRRYEVRSPIED